MACWRALSEQHCQDQEAEEERAHALNPRTPPICRAALAQVFSAACNYHLQLHGLVAGIEPVPTT